MTQKKKISQHFKEKDPIIHRLHLVITFNEVIPSTHYFEDLCDSIISQQLSVKASATIFKRFKEIMPKQEITPEQVLSLPSEQLRQVGISFAKISYIKDLAEKVLHEEIHLNKLAEMSDQEVIEELTKVKGIGVWTAEMFLMFSLGREDIFSCGDLGLQKAVQKQYGLKEKITKEQLLKLSAQWAPYRTYAARFLWKSLELP